MNHGCRSILMTGKKKIPGASGVPSQALNDQILLNMDITDAGSVPGLTPVFQKEQSSPDQFSACGMRQGIHNNEIFRNLVFR